MNSNEWRRVPTVGPILKSVESLGFAVHVSRRDGFTTIAATGPRRLCATASGGVDEGLYAAACAIATQAGIDLEDG